jgi:hypothetical protein
MKLKVFYLIKNNNIMRDSLKPKSPIQSPEDFILKNMGALQNTQEKSKTVGKHRLNLSLPAALFDELRDESEKKGLTVTAYLITLINKALGKD